MVKTDEKHGYTGHRFPKSERLCSIKDIEELFSKGSSTFLYPFKILYLHCDNKPPYPQVLFSVPKKNFRKAVDRNRIKRQLKEIYRQNKGLIFFNEGDNFPIPCYIGIIYVAKQHMAYKLMEHKLISVLLRLKKTEL